MTDIHGELGASSTVLKKIVRPPETREFFPNELEWVARNREQIIRFQESSGMGNVTIFLVPDNFTFWLTNACLSSSGGNTNVAIRIFATTGSPATTGNLLAVKTSTVAGSRPTSSVAQSYIMPIKVNAGEQLRIVSDLASTVNNCCISGWLEPRIIVP